jgi:hypothetical protein
MFTLAVIPFICSVVVPLGAFLAVVVQFYSTHSDSDRPFPQIVPLLFQGSRRPLVRWSILLTALTVTLTIHIIFLRLFRLLRVRSGILPFFLAISGCLMALTLVGLTFFNPVLSPILSLINSTIFFFTACIFHVIVDNLPHRSSMAVLFAKPLGFVLIGSTFIGFIPDAMSISSVKAPVLTDISALFQNIAFCVIFVKLGLTGFYVLKTPVRRSDRNIPVLPLA